MNPYRQRIFNLCTHTIDWFQDVRRDPIYAAFLLERHFEYVDMLIDPSDG